LKKAAAALFLLILLLFSGCGNTQAKTPALPKTEFDSRAVKIRCGEQEISGLLSAGENGTFLFTLTSPEAFAGLRLRHTAAGDKTQFGALSYAGDLLSRFCLPELFAAIEAASNTQALSREEAGFSGHTASGEAFSLETAENGAISRLTLGGVSAEFTPQEEQAEAETSEERSEEELEESAGERPQEELSTQETETD
jgi:hypothetical protein